MINKESFLILVLLFLSSISYTQELVLKFDGYKEVQAGNGNIKSKSDLRKGCFITFEVIGRNPKNKEDHTLYIRGYSSVKRIFSFKGKLIEHKNIDEKLKVSLFKAQGIANDCCQAYLVFYVEKDEKGNDKINLFYFFLESGEGFEFKNNYMKL